MQTVAGLSNQRPYLEKEEVPQQSDSARELKKVRIVLPRPAQRMPAATTCVVSAYQRRSPQNDMQYRSPVFREAAARCCSVSRSQTLEGNGHYQSC